MALSTITVAGINPNLNILGAIQQLNYNQNLSTFQLNNSFIPTSLIPGQINSEFRNNLLSGFRWIHLTSNTDTYGSLTLQSFVNASPTGTNLIDFNSSGIDIFTALNMHGQIITNSIWEGTAIGVEYGGTGLTSTTINQILYSSAANVISGLATANSGILITSSGGVPSISSTLPNAVQENITSLGTITNGAWNGSGITVSYGGTGLTSTAAYTVLCGGTTSTGILQSVSGLGTSGQVLTSQGTGALPIWDSLSALGVTSITGTANQISASSSIGAVTLSLATTTVMAGTYQNTTLTVDAYGRITAASTGSSAPTAATYILQTPNSNLTNAQVLSALSSGILQNTTGTGVLSIATQIIDTYNATPAAGFNNLFVGITAGNSSTTGQYNTGGGGGALRQLSTGSQNSAFGNVSLISLTTGLNNSAYGHQSLFTCVTGSQNSAFGTFALVNLTANGGDNNTAIGYLAGWSYDNYINCTFLGANVDTSVNNLMNATAIGYGAIVGASNSLVLGNGANVGIGDSVPGSKLSVVGNVQIGFSSGTTAPTNGLIVNGNIGIGTSTPSTTLEIASTVGALLVSRMTQAQRNALSSPQNGTILYNTDSGGAFNFREGGNWLTLPSGGVASSNASYITQTQDINLSNSQYLSALSTGILKNTTSTGVLSIATAGSDYYSPGYPTYIIDTTALTTFNLAMGSGSLTNITTGSNNAAFGYQSLYSLTTGVFNSAFGHGALYSLISGLSNVAIGWGAASGFSSYTNCTFIGVSADASANNLTNATAIGYNTFVGASNTLVLGNGANVGIGDSVPGSKLSVVGNVQVGFSSGTAAPSNGLIVNGNTSIGSSSAVSLFNVGSSNQFQINNSGVITNGIWNGSLIALANGGTNANLTASNGGIFYSTGSSGAILAGTSTANQILVSGSSTTPSWVSCIIDTYNSTSGAGLNNLFIGYQAGNITTGQFNIAIGTSALGSTITNSSSYNSIFGYQAAYNLRNSKNSVFGYQALYTATTETNNTAIGYQALYTLNDNQTNNTAIGYQAGYTYFSCDCCTFIGAGADTNSTSQITNATAIGFGAIVSASNMMVLGNGVNVGIGDSVPGSKLSVVGNVQVGFSSGTAAPSNGLIVNGNTSIGSSSAVSLFNVGSSNQFQINNSGVITNGIWNGNLIALANGGTNANLTASNGGIFYSTGSAGAILAGTATANQLLLSGSSSAPSWSTVTHPTTTTINQILYSSANNVLAGLVTANNGVLITSSGGVPSISSALPSTVQGNITSVGTIASGAWNGSTVTVPYGGTGVTSTTAYSVLCGGTTSTGAFQSVASVGTSGQVLTSQGSGTLPIWQSLSASGVTSITGTTNQVIASSSTGAVTLSLPQSIATTSTVQFGKLGLNGVASASTLEIVSGSAQIGFSSGTASPSTGLIVSGNVGIGTSSPSSNGVLTVNGNIIVGSGTIATATSANATIFGNDICLGAGGNDAVLYFNGYFNGGDKYLLNDYATQLWMPTSTGKLRLRYAGSGTAGSAVTWNYGITLDMVNGRLGIFTDTPAYPLDVNGIISTNASIGINAVPPSTTGTISTAPPASSSPTIITIGTAFQNTLGYDVMLSVYLNITVNTGGKITCGVGSSSTPTQQTLVNGITMLGYFPISVYLPNTYYCLIDTSGSISITASVTGAQITPV